MNFLPEKIKDSIKKEYFYRYSSIILFLSFISITLVSILYMPTYIFSVYRSNSIDNQLLSTDSSVLDYKTGVIEEIDRVNEATNILSIKGQSLEIGDALNALIQKKNDNIKISSVSAKSDSPTSARVIISGISKTREGLILFVDDLKKSESFTNTSLPVSNLVKSSNIDFTITIILNK